MTKKFALVEWIADEQFGTKPVSAVQDADKDKLHVGMKTKMRYPVKGKRYYDVEILKLSGLLTIVFVVVHLSMYCPTTPPRAYMGL